jgi:hypothetical protein
MTRRAFRRSKAQIQICQRRGDHSFFRRRIEFERGNPQNAIAVADNSHHHHHHHHHHHRHHPRNK